MKKIVSTLFSAIILSGGAQLFAISEPYHSIRKVSYEPYYFENSWILLEKINYLDPTVFIDVESPNGEASRFIGSQDFEKLKVYTINSWNKNSHQFQQFLSNVIAEESTEKVIPIRMTSSEAAAALNLRAEIIYIDCNDIDSVSEKIQDWAVHLSQNGVIAGNRWEWPEVELAVINAVEELSLSVSIIGNYWFLSRDYIQPLKT